MSKRDWRLLQAYLATGLTPEQIEALKARIQAMESEADGAEEAEESADLEEEEAHE